MSSVIDENTQFIDPLTSTPILNGYIYIGANGLDAVLNPITIYSDRDLTIPLSNPQRTDSSGRSVNKIWVPGRYSMKVTDSGGIQKLNDLDLGELANTGTTLLTNVQGADTITAEGSPTITTLTDGQLYVFTTILANTGAVTLQIDSTTAYPVKKNHDVALVANDFEANQVIVIAWNSTDSVFELQSSTAKESVKVVDNQTVAGIKTFSTGISTIDILDSNGNEIITPVGVANAVNEVTIKNAATTVNPTVQSSGEANTGLILADSNGNEAVILESTVSAVNEITITNAATGNPPDITATGGDTNVDLELNGQGTGNPVNGRAVSGYVSGMTEFIESDTGLASTALDVLTGIAATTWESVGPTGSGATNIWTALDVVPTNTKYVILTIHINAFYNAGTGTLLYLDGRKTGSTETAVSPGGKTNMAAAQLNATGSGATSVQTRTVVEKRLPVNASNQFDLYWSYSSYTAGSSDLGVRLTGWGI